jgi:hypothetical protein
MKKYRARVCAHQNDYNCRIHPVIKYESPAINTHLVFPPVRRFLCSAEKSSAKLVEHQNFGVAREIYYLIKCCRLKNV